MHYVHSPGGRNIFARLISVHALRLISPVDMKIRRRPTKQSTTLSPSEAKDSRRSANTCVYLFILTRFEPDALRT